MKFTTHVPEMGNIDLTIEITMKVDEWRDLMRQIGTNYPGWKFAAEVASVIGRFSRACESQYITDPN